METFAGFEIFGLLSEVVLSPHEIAVDRNTSLFSTRFQPDSIFISDFYYSSSVEYFIS